MLKNRVARNATDGSPKTAYHKEKRGRFVKHNILALKKIQYFQIVDSISHIGETGTNSRVLADPLSIWTKTPPSSHPQESPLPFAP